MYVFALAGPPPTPKEMVGIVLLGVFGFVFALHMVAWMAGWKTLAARFRYDAPFVGSMWRWQCAKFRWGSRYNNCLTVGANSEGLYLAMMPVFNFGHAPLLIPWSEITERAKGTLFGPVFILTLGSEEQLPMMIGSALALKIEKAKKQNFPVK